MEYKKILRAIRPPCPKCPYHLDTPNVLKYMLEDYWQFYEEHKAEL